jgi:uncharacterized membrane protein
MQVLRVFRILCVVGVFLCVLVPSEVIGQEVDQDRQETVSARVESIEDTYTRAITGTDAISAVQELRVRLLSGQRAGDVVQVKNELVELEEGDRIFVNHLQYTDGTEEFVFKEVDRRSLLGWVVVSFVVLVLWFTGMKGLRALLSLGLSLTAILLVLIPLLLAGYPAAWVSLGIAAAILAIILFFTHGINARSVTAFAGTVGAVTVTCALAAYWVSALRLTGFGSDASVYLNFSTDGTLDFSGLLLGSIIIGLLGVLDDVSVTQASVVQELRAANPSFGFIELYQRAIRVGRDHVGSLINTLSLAYVGAALPLIMLYVADNSAWSMAVNQEIIAAEVLRILIGSMGLVLAVPLTTALAAWYFSSREVSATEVVATPCSHGHE